MSFAVFTDNAGPVHGEDNGKILQADVMDNLVIGALQKCAVDGHNRL